MAEKTIHYYIVIDYRKEKVKARKTEPNRSDLGTNEMVVKGETTVNEPEVDIPTMASELNVPKSRVRKALVDGIDEADIPDWFETVDEVFDTWPDMVEDEATDALLGKVMIEDPGSPDPEAVREEIQQRLYERTQPHQDPGNDHPRGGEA